MYPRTRNPHEHRTPVTDPSWSAIVISSLAFVAGPVAVFYLASHGTLGGLLLVIALTATLSIRYGYHEPARSEPERSPGEELPVWFDGVDRRRRTATGPRSD